MKTKYASMRWCVCFGLLFLGYSVELSASEKHGDAVLTKGGQGFPLHYGGLLSFPRIPIGSCGTTRFKVPDLPVPIYPSGFDLDVPEAKSFHVPLQSPWQNCLIKASLVDVSGHTFYSRTIDFKHGIGDGMFFLFTDYQPDGKTTLPKYRSYIIEVQVIRPSLRASDRLKIYAPTNFGIAPSQ